MFDALIHEKIDCEGLEFEVKYEDIQTLNLNAFDGRPDISKLSTAALTRVLDNYQILNSGSAMGFGVGPLLIARKEIPNLEAEISALRIAIPGKNTTARFLLQLAFPQIPEPVEMLFSEIEDAVLDGRVDAGLIIHENRFTYPLRGLVKLLDLGEFWESRTGLPIPLAGIAVRRSLPLATRKTVDRVLARSIRFAFDNPGSGIDYIRAHSQEMEESVMYRHIELYVNRFSEDLGEEGKAAFNRFFDQAQATGLMDSRPEDLFLSNAGSQASF